MYESDDSLVQEHEEDSSSSLNSDRSTSLESDIFSPAQFGGLRILSISDWLNLFHMRVEVKLFSATIFFSF